MGAVIVKLIFFSMFSYIWRFNDILMVYSIYNVFIQCHYSRSEAQVPVDKEYQRWGKFLKQQGPVVQSIVSLTSSLRVISLTVLADSIYNILLFFAEKM